MCQSGMLPAKHVVNVVTLVLNYFQEKARIGREHQASEKVKVEGDSSSPTCGLNVQMINAYLRFFRNIQVVKKSDSCAFTTSNYYYLLNITR